MRRKCFSEDLLTKSKKERYDFFKNYIVSHPMLEDVLTKILRTVTLSQPGQLIYVFGPTGVGKTTLIKSLNKKVTDFYIDELNKDRTFVPIVSVEAMMPTVGNFNWTDLLSELLNHINVPAAQYPFAGNTTNDIDKEKRDFFRQYGNSKLTRLRFGFEKSVKYRKVKLINIDEAQHLGIVSSARKVLHQPNTIKSISNRTDTVTVLYGTYELLMFQDLNGQLARRTEDIHFSRYDFDNIKHRKLFRDIIWSFESYMPIKNSPELLTNWKYLYEKSIGCVGILKQWLDRAFSLMLEENKEDMTLDYLERTSLSDAKCLTIAEETTKAEEKLKESLIKTNELKKLLKMSKNIKKSPPHDDSNKNDKKNNKRRVGERNPHRDRIGEIPN